ncbi:MAG: GNAT family N-acetyltransferase [Actinomycetia bacterium]|nr:GNAT family N-acetyltransferase [Actinomycetes bacterium]
MELCWPEREMLESYVDALRRSWSPNTLRPEATAEELEQIRVDAVAFLASLVDREATGDPITLPDGTQAARLPGYRMWMWDGAFCGSISFRWQPGSSALPPYVLGHIGYSVVPWKEGRGYAKRALSLLLPMVKAEGLDHVELSTDLGNIASRKIIEANGGVMVGQVDDSPWHGPEPVLRYRIDLS